MYNQMVRNGKENKGGTWCACAWDRECDTRWSMRLEDTGPRLVSWEWYYSWCWSDMKGEWCSQCVVMAYVIDTPSQCLESYIILTPADVGWCLDSVLFDMLADSCPLWWSPVHEMYHPAVCNMMGGPPSFLLSILDQREAVWYAGFQQYIKHICNLSISVKAAPLMISGALNGPSSCLWYDEGTRKLLVEYLTSMESCHMQDSNSTSYIFVTSVHQ